MLLKMKRLNQFLLFLKKWISPASLGIGRHSLKSNYLGAVLGEILPLKKPLSLEDFILTKITKDVPYFHLYLLSPLPPFYLNRILNKLEKTGRITKRILPYEGRAYSRTDLI